MNSDILNILAGIPRCTPDELADKRTVSVLILVAAIVYTYLLFKLAIKQYSKLKKSNRKTSLKILALTFATGLLLVVGLVVIIMVGMFTAPLCSGF